MAEFMDIFDLYNTAAADNNTQQSGHLRPQTNFQAWVNVISKELFNDNYGKAGKNQKIRDIIDAAFLQTKNVTVKTMPGKDYDFIIFPADYAYFASVRAFKNEKSDCGCIQDGFDILDSVTGKTRKWEDPDTTEIKSKFKGTSVGEAPASKVDNKNWGSALAHKLKPPSWKRVKITEIEGGFKVVPKGMGIILMDYYRYPKEAFFAYTTNPDGTINYNLSGSTQLDWPKQMEPYFLAAIKQRFASFTNQDNKYQQAVLEKNQTMT